MIRAISACLGLLLVTPAYADMFPNAANADLPEAQDNLGIARSVTAYGAKCDGTTDDTAALQAAINANQLDGTTGAVPTLKITGTCLTGPLTIGGQIRIEGETNFHGNGQLRLKAGSDAALLTVQTTGTGNTAFSTPNGQVILSYLQLTSQDGKGTNATHPNAHGLRFVQGTWGPWIVPDHLVVWNMPGNGIDSFLSQGAIQGYKVYSGFNGGHGLASNSDNDFAFTDSQFPSNEKNGVNLQGVSSFRCANCDVYFNHNIGMYLGGQSTVNFFGGMTDGNYFEGWRINGSTAPAAINIYGTRIGNNSNGNPNLYSDIGIVGGAAATVVNLYGVSLGAPRPAVPANNPKYSIEFTGGSLTRVNCIACDFAGNKDPAVTPGFTNQLQNISYTVGTAAGLRGGGKLPGPVVLAQSGAFIGCTANGAEQNLVAVKVPGGSMGANGRVRVYMTWALTNSANVKTHKIRVSTTQGDIATGFTMYNGSVTASAVLEVEKNIWNSNSTSLQYASLASGPVGYPGAGIGAQGGTLNTLNDWYININCSTANGVADLNELRGYTVEVLPRD